MGQDLVAEVNKFFLDGCLREGLNHMNIVLIKKNANLEMMSEFRPISLCNVIYKVISKVLANRIKEVLDYVILELQSTFITSHLITDNIMISF